MTVGKGQVFVFCPSLPTLMTVGEGQNGYFLSRHSIKRHCMRKPGSLTSMLPFASLCHDHPAFRDKYRQNQVPYLT